MSLLDSKPIFTLDGVRQDRVDTVQVAQRRDHIAARRVVHGGEIGWPDIDPRSLHEVAVGFERKGETTIFEEGEGVVAFKDDTRSFSLDHDSEGRWIVFCLVDRCPYVPGRHRLDSTIFPYGLGT